jgi:hypothetical protein
MESGLMESSSDALRTAKGAAQKKKIEVFDAFTR